MDEFDLKEKEFIELHDLLKVLGICSSGGMAKKAIAAGLVMVDGNVELQKRCKIRKGHIVEYEGQSIKVTLRNK
jgi:ribosome-associated protein